MKKKNALAYVLLAIVFLMPGLSAAQSFMPEPVNNMPITNPANVSERGWAQIYNRAELTAFALDVAVALALAAAIALHPVRRAARASTMDFLMPRLFAFYALIGMVVGFLVDQHGYIIGFVVFGIGALLRFRSNLDDPIDTVEMILVTVLGLCVGLDLPVMAVAIGVVSWALIWIAGRRIPIELRLQADSADQLQDGLDRARATAQRHGWKEAFMHRSHAKHSARLVLLHSASVNEEGIEAALLEALDDEAVTWRLER